MREKKIAQLIARHRGVKDADEYSAFNLLSPDALIESSREIMSNSPIGFGECALLSASWAAYLQDHYSIPAIVVAGDLKIGGVTVFKTKKNIPSSSKKGKIINEVWDGHCWIEVDGIIGDLSIFRTAYGIQGASILKEYVMSKFGPGKGVMLCPANDLPPEMSYIPKYILKDNQINGLVGGMVHKLENGI